MFGRNANGHVFALIYLLKLTLIPNNILKTKDYHIKRRNEKKNLKNKKIK
jgi:hypothetical protein